MARVINADGATIVGTLEQIARLLELLRGKGAGVVNLDRANFVILDKPLTHTSVKSAIEATPRKGK
ncbi:MAG TPA: hypothetical protein PL151_09485 [Phycisphaerae bacterium]|nr:hypothetical protein [Phycisphaerae bacterium]HOM53626.1 hypothetical protein [Phycisphaerae bacterium]HON68339.1 hypothetical protein [Phycisphaerae bacterium]HPP28984.1 hypothetical protein [Phycisphaerae bacterium]HPZ96967.1 hypothetical protein [Phycisphaerae bacterium]